jgi:hypothetical protein
MDLLRLARACAAIPSLGPCPWPFVLAQTRYAEWRLAPEPAPACAGKHLSSVLAASLATAAVPMRAAPDSGFPVGDAILTEIAEAAAR